MNDDDGADKYTLPSCGHTFHTDCIMTWFRSHQTRCPLCNHSPPHDDDEDMYYFNRNDMDMHVRVIRSRKSTDPAIVAELKRLDKLTSKLKTTTKALNDIKKVLKKPLSELVTEYGDIQVKHILSKLSSARSARYAASWKVRQQQRTLARLVPIVPIVLPVRARQQQRHAMQLRSG
jgi:hypothetical protein